MAPEGQKAFQDLITQNHCWGCGPDNPEGLRIKSYWSGDESVCTFQPADHHCAAATNVLNGGIIASLIDCHCICTAMVAAYRDAGRLVGEGERMDYVTAALQVSYKRPTPVGVPLDLRARITQSTGRKYVLECTLSAGGEVCATGEVVAVRLRS